MTQPAGLCFYLTVADAARMAEMTPAGLKAAADRGELLIAARTRCRNRLFRLRDVEAFARARAGAKHKKSTP